MPTRRILRPWTTQPPSVTGVNLAHPSTADLLFLFNGATGVNSVEPAGPRNRAGSNVLQPGREGTGFLTNDSGWWEFQQTQSKRNAAELSILLVVAYTRHTAYDACKLYTGRTWTTDYLGSECYYNGGNIFAGATGAGDLNLGASAGVGATNVVWITWSGTSVRACANGRDDVTGSRSVFNINNNPQSVVIGCNVNTGLGITRGSLLYLGAIWNRALSRAERDAIGGNPWILFEPQQIYVPRSAGEAGYTHPTLSNARMIWTGLGAGKPAIDYTW